MKFDASFRREFGGVQLVRRQTEAETREEIREIFGPTSLVEPFGGDQFY